MTRRPLTVELLEDRSTPALIGAPWPYPGDLTLSFVPDGTRFGAQTSSLFRTLDATAPTAVWEGEVLRAFNTWAAETNIHIRVVADDGEPIGTLGLKEGDSRFGDIRVAAFPMAADVLAVANPYNPFVADTSVGDVYLNSAYPFHAGGRGGGYDLYSVLLHEAGHVFGLGHSDDPNSPMFENFHADSAGPTAADAATIRSVYGAPGSDSLSWTYRVGNAWPDAAPGAAPQLLATTPGYVEHTYYQLWDVLTAGDRVKNYIVQSTDLAPGMTNVMTVKVVADYPDSSDLDATVLDSRGNVVDSQVIVDAAGVYQIQVPNVGSNEKYVVRVTGGGAPGGDGAGYDLHVDFALDGKNLVPFVSDTLQADRAESLQTLRVLKSQQFHLVLSASDFNDPAETGARMTVADARGQVVFAMTVGDGATRAGDVFLNAGEYTVRFTRAAGGSATPLFFHLAGLVTTDAIGPGEAGIVDTTLNPVSPTAGADLGALSFFWLPYSPPAIAAAPAASPAFGAPDMLALPGAGGTSMAATPVRPAAASANPPAGGADTGKAAAFGGAVSPVYTVECEAQAALDPTIERGESEWAIPAPRLIEGSVGERLVKADAARFKGHADTLAGFVPSNPSLARQPRESRVSIETPLAVEAAALVSFPAERRTADKLDRVAGTCGLALGAVAYLARKPVRRSALGRIAGLGKRVRGRTRVSI